MKIAIVGNGTMGSRLTREFVARGHEVVVFRASSAPEAGQESLVDPSLSALEFLSTCDLVFENVKEDEEVKRRVLDTIASRTPAHIATGTSSLPLSLLAMNSPSCADRLIALHFFNPPSIIKFVEVATIHNHAGAALMCDALTDMGFTVAKVPPTAGFIASRIGCFTSTNVEWKTSMAGLSPAEADVLFGLPLDRPSTGCFKLADLIGLDVVKMITDNIKKGLMWEDPMASSFVTLPLFEELIDLGALGFKTGKGVYEGRGKRCWDSEFKQYASPSLERVSGLAAALRVVGWKEKIRILKEHDDVVIADLVLDHLFEVLKYSNDVAYSLDVSPELVDLCLNKGYVWAKGPFTVMRELEVFVEDDPAQTTKNLRTLLRG